MKNKENLFLHEEILLLALRDEKGTIASGCTCQYALGGAILAELLLQKRIRAATERKKKFVELVSPKSVGDPLLDECLERIAGARRRATFRTWVSRFASIRKLTQRVAERLCDRGILRADESKILLVFTRRTYPELDGIPEKKLIERLRKAIFTGSLEIDPRTVVLVSLAEGSGLLKLVFDRKKLKERKRRIKKIVSGDIAGGATREAIEAMQAAVMVACIMPAVTASTASATH